MFEEEAKQYKYHNTNYYDYEDFSIDDGEEIEEAFKNGAECGYYKASEWHYVTDKLPPNPKESEDGKSIIPLNYICAYDCGDGDYECDEFMYLGDGVWNGENKNYPIYAWMDCAVEIPFPKKENE